ncbi:MAG: hypothetical protein GY944_24865 [bacterium]|nr:hypothetical protein [bacterium]
MSTSLVDRERESILAGLSSSDDELRRLSVERLLALPVGEALGHLVVSLGDVSWRVRKAGVERLVACSETALVADALLAALADGENPGRRNAAVEALVCIGPEVLPRLVAELASGDVDVRKLLVDTIAGIGHEDGRDAMIATLEDSDPNVRAAAADALGAIGGESAVPCLRVCAIDPMQDQLVRLSALHALVHLDATVRVEELAAVFDDPVLAAAGCRLLGNLDDESATARLLKGLGEGYRATREAAMDSLLRMLSRRDGAEAAALERQIREAARAHSDATASTIDRLADADLATRLVIVQFLGIVGDPDSVIPILESGRDEAIAEVAIATLARLGETSERAVDRAWEQLDSALRCEACRLLGRTGGERAIERLLEALDASDVAQRTAAANALATCAAQRALEPLVRRLGLAARDDDFEAEEECVVLVDAIVDVCTGGPGNPEESLVAQAVELLASRLEGGNEINRQAIANVLGRIGREQDTPLVASLMKDSSAEVRRAAVDALSRFGAAGSAEPLRLAMADESHLVRIAAAMALARSTQPDVRADLEGLLQDEDWRVRAATLRAVGSRQGGALGVDDKLTLIESGLGDHGAVCMAAVEALAEVGGESAARIAASLLDRAEPEIVQAAVSCIGRHGDGEQLQRLLPLVSHDHWAVRAEAIQVLAERRHARGLPSILRRLETERDSFVRDAILHGLKRLEV